jgi:hypothetical protein
LTTQGGEPSFGQASQVGCPASHEDGQDNRLPVLLPDVVSMQTRQPNFERADEIPLCRLVTEAPLRMRLRGIVVALLLAVLQVAV